MVFVMKTPTLIIRYKGLFDFNAVYNAIVQWMKQKRYWFHERDYKHKVPSPAGAEQEIRFMGNRKIHEFEMEDIEVYFHIWEMTEVEVVQEGITKKLTNARMEILLKGTVTVDWEKRWEENWLYQLLFDIYRKYIAKEEVETIYYDNMHYRLHKLQALIKETLDMQAKGYEYAGYLKDQV
jgi:hypothetical protein